MRQLLPEGSVRVGVLVALPTVLSALGANPTAICREAGIEPTLLDDADKVISYAARGHLFEVCVQQTGCEHIGLLVGRQGSLSSFGPIGFLARASQDVGAALRCLERFFHLHVQGAQLSTVQQGGLTRFRYEIYQPGVEAAPQIEDGAMAWALRILQELCGASFRPSEVRFSHRAPRDIRPYRHLFQTPLLFNSRSYGMYFPSEALERALESADPALHRLLEKQVDSLQVEYHESFLDHLERAMHSLFAVRPATAEDVAELFLMSSRTLDRRLRALGTRYGQVADEVRCQMACHALSVTDRPLAEVADQLHYADASAFIKAFKRWTGTTPARWRGQKTVGQAGPGAP